MSPNGMLTGTSLSPLICSLTVLELSAVSVRDLSLSSCSLTISTHTQTFSKKDFKQDFYLDQAILRRIQRAKQAQEHHHVDDDFDDDDDEDEDEHGANERSIVEGHARMVRKPKQER
jgi:hypothetical protein